MQLVSALAAGVKGAENGTARIYNRAGGSEIAYYQGGGGFEGQGQKAAGTPLQLDQYGSAVVYVSQYALVRVYDDTGVVIRTFTEGSYDENVEVRSTSFTGTDYLTGVSAADGTKPVSLAAVLDLWKTSAGAADFKVLFGGSATNISAILTSLGGYLLSVKDYGAEGDGINNDTGAILACSNAANTQGKVVYFPAGTYRVTSTISIASGVSMLGAGPADSIIQIDDASDDLFSHGASTTPFSLIQGLAFGAKQSHTGPLFTIAASGRFVFRDCRFGDDLTLSASGNAFVLVTTNSVTPHLVFDECHFYLPDGFAGQGVTDGTATANHVVQVKGGLVEYAADAGSTNPFFQAPDIQVSNVVFDVTATTSGGSDPQMIGAIASGVVTVTGCRLSASTSANPALINPSTAKIVETGNSWGTNCSLFSATAQTNSGAAMLGSRKGRVYAVSHAGASGALDIGSEIDEADHVVVTITDGNAFTLSCSPTSKEGLEFELFLENNAGGATGTITYSATQFKALTSVTGTAPVTSIAAVGSVASTRFRCYDGPDGVAWYPVGQTYVGT